MIKNWRIFRKKGFYKTPFDDIHVMPNNDLKKHWSSWNCWCKPKILNDFPPYEIVHCSKDGREIKEMAEEFNLFPRV